MTSQVKEAGLAIHNGKYQRYPAPGNLEAEAGTRLLTNAMKPPKKPSARSIATTERILVSAEALMSRLGGKFTLGDVAASAHVSMASIYSRYPSKDHLVREVQARVLDGLIAQIATDLAPVADEAGNLEWRTTRVTDIYAEAHRSRAAIIRALYSFGGDDPPMKQKAFTTAQELTRLGINGIVGPKIASLPPHMEADLRMILQTFQHAVESVLGFSQATASPHIDWSVFKVTAGRMVYLAAREALEQ